MAKACEVCHNVETKNTPEIGKKAEDILTRINFIHAYRKWILLYYSEKKPKIVNEINTLYKDIVYSWHKFNFDKIDEKTKEILLKLKAIYHKELAEKSLKKQK